MATMKALAVVAPNKVEVVDDVPMPEPNDYEALVKIHACGFCTGTDFLIISGVEEGVGPFGKFPTILGHEAAGEAVSVGKKVKNIKIGDRFIDPMQRPGATGKYSLTYGCMAEYGLVVDKQAMLADGLSWDPFFTKQGPFPAGVDFVDAGVLLSLAECHSAARNFGAKAGDDVLIYGAGPMGMALGMFIKLMGARTVIQVDGIQERLEHAKKVAKVDEVVNIAQQDIDRELAGRRFDLVIDAVGLTSILLEASSRLKPGGKVGSLGVIKKKDKMIDVTMLKDNSSLHMLNQPYGEYEIMAETSRLILDGRIDPKDFYTHALPFTEIEKVMELVRSRQAFKAVLTF